MTRITNQILISNLIKNLRDNVERMDTLSNQLSSGKRVTKPSDDPLAASRGLFYRRVIRENDQFKLNTDDASAFLSSTSQTLEDVRTSLRAARNLALQGSSDASNIPNETMATEVEQIFDYILNLGNEAHDGKYIFAGDKSKAKPFVNNGGIVSFAGDSSKRKAETGLGVTVDSNITGEEQFGTRAHKIVGISAALPTNVPMRVALGAKATTKNILTSATAVAPAAGNVSELTTINAANFAGFVAGTITINNGVTNYDVTVNSGDSLGTVLDNISQVPGINAYFRASDGRIILSNDFGQNVTVTDNTATFATVATLGNLNGGTNSTTQEIFSVKAGTTSTNVVDYVDPNYDTNEELASAVSASRLLVGTANLNGGALWGAAFNRGTTLMSANGAFTAGTLTITVNGVARTITTDVDDTMQTIVKRINSQMGAIGVHAYVRRVTTGGADANTLILAGSQDQTIAVADGGGGNFAAQTGLAVGTDVRTGSNVEGTVDDAGMLSLTSRIEDSAGEMAIRQGANRAQNAGGILESLNIADSDGVVRGKDLRPGQIFERLSKMQSALRGRAFGRDTLMNLQDGTQTNLGLQPGDLITFTADTNVGAPTTLTMTVGGGAVSVNSLQDIADQIQNFLRTNVNVQAQTAIVQIVDGRITITNPQGASVNGAATNVSQPITVTAFSATDSTGVTARTTFNNTMQNLVNAGQIQDDGSSASTYTLTVPFISQNVSDSISDLDTLISRTGTNQGNVGSVVQKLELTKNRLEDANTTFTSLMSENEDVDMAKAVLEFQSQQNVYQAALGAAARILGPSLLDFLR